MSWLRRFRYYERIFAAYLAPGESQLTFWHETPQLNPRASIGSLGEYYMTFREKAAYTGHHDLAGVPMLDYRGSIGVQYNPIAVAQWGLGNYNQFAATANLESKRKFLRAADWLCAQLEQNRHGLWVWNHQFDWEYRNLLKAPWYSALAQGQGISLLVRAHQVTGKAMYSEVAGLAFESFRKNTSEGGVCFTDSDGDLWFEEYVVSPPTHILNGCMWATWGVHDYLLATHDHAAVALFERAVQTLLHNLDRYDLGFWSLYELSDTSLPMVASPYYHQLHIVQLRVMHRLTGEEKFVRLADRWENYGRSRSKRTRALCYKSAFKLCYY
jgi:heparosan-N-sulfate-glucuronate 5-epimerase